MIAACPSCGARYRIDRAKLRPEGARLRCSRCENVFRVRAPEAPAPSRPKAPAKPLQTPRLRPARPQAPEAMPELAVRAPETRQPAAPPPRSEAPVVAAERRVAALPVAESAKTTEFEGPILIAHPEEEAGRQVADALAARGLQTLLVHDGVEAILNIQRALPQVVVLDAALPKMFGFQVCEIVKRNESLRGIHVVLVGAIHDQDRYRRPPRDLYGADAYVERHQLPDALIPLLEGFGVSLGPPAPLAARPPAVSVPAPSPAPRELEARSPLEAPRDLSMPDPSVAPRERSTPDPPPESFWEDPGIEREEEPSPSSARTAYETEVSQPLPATRTGDVASPGPAMPASSPPAAADPVRAPSGQEPAAVEPAPAVVDPALSAETEQAERLARIIVSDVVLYNPEKFEAGVRDGNVVAVLGSELEEGRSLFAQRVDPRVGNPADFLERELLRVARSRGMK